MITAMLAIVDFVLEHWLQTAIVAALFVWSVGWMLDQCDPAELRYSRSQALKRLMEKR